VKFQGGQPPSTDREEEDARARDQERARTSPPKSATEQLRRRPDWKERWGILPPKEAENLVNAMSGKIPERYRRWIEAYYRRVSVAPKR
jgi:hypothetical protein